MVENEYKYDNQKEYDIKETAELLEVSTRTVRKRLKEGTLDGYKRTTKYGPKWFIPAEEIEVEKAAVDVVPFRKPISSSEFKSAVKESLKAAVKERDQELINRISRMMDHKIEKKLNELNEVIIKTSKLAEDRDKKLVKLIRERRNKEQEGKNESILNKVRSFFMGER